MIRISISVRGFIIILSTQTLEALVIHADKVKMFQYHLWGKILFT